MKPGGSAELELRRTRAAGKRTVARTLLFGVARLTGKVSALEFLAVLCERRDDICLTSAVGSVCAAVQLDTHRTLEQTGLFAVLFRTLHKRLDEEDRPREREREKEGSGTQIGFLDAFDM